MTGINWGRWRRFLGRNGEKIGRTAKWGGSTEVEDNRLLGKSHGHHVQHTRTLNDTVVVSYENRHIYFHF